MAAFLWFGRVLPVFLLVLLALTGTARAGHFLTHPAAAPQAPQAPQAAQAAQATVPPQAEATQGARTLFEKGKEIKIKRDAKVTITPQNIPKGDRFLKAYSADQAPGASAAPGLLGIASQAYRTQASAGTANKAYSLADAMRDAVWRKKTAAKLKSMTTSQSACAGGSAKKAPSIGLVATC